MRVRGWISHSFHIELMSSCSELNAKVHTLGSGIVPPPLALGLGVESLPLTSAAWKAECKAACT